MYSLKQKCILFVAEQVGGIDALLPVIQKIQNNKKFTSFLFVQSKDILGYARKKGIKNIRLVNLQLGKIQIENINPAIIFTDTNNTDYEHSIDKKIIKIARDISKPTISIVDAWKSYKERFGKNLAYVPNHVLVIDREMKIDLEKMGIPRNIITITGSPRFEKLSQNKKKKEEKNSIIFYSEPFSSGQLTEINVFKDIIQVIEKEYPKKKIIIKFHPSREKDRAKYDTIIKDSRLLVKKANQHAKAEDLTPTAELIIGMTSIALFDAALIGKKVLSYQPGKNNVKDVLRSNMYGWSTPVYKKEHLSQAIKNVFTKKNPKEKKQRTQYTKNKSTEKIMLLINRIINGK